MSTDPSEALSDELRLISAMIESLAATQPAVIRFYREIQRTSESLAEFQRRALANPDSYRPDHRRMVDDISDRLVKICDAVDFTQFPQL